MFKKLLQKFQKWAAHSRDSIDPIRFDDPVAMLTDWGPLKGGGTNFRTHALVEVDPEKVAFRATWGAKSLFLVFLFVGVMALVWAGTLWWQFIVDSVPLGGPMFVSVFGSAFTLVGAWLYRSGTTPIVFDKRTGFFWKGRVSPEETFNSANLKDATRLESIHAIQLLSEYCRSDKSSYYSYELNLILKEGERLNVIDHGNLRSIQKDANTLAEFLDIPVWDTTE